MRVFCLALLLSASAAAQVAPGDDFYRHVNGAWLDTEPSERVDEEDRLRGWITEILDETTTAASVEAGTPAQRIRDLYRSLTDSVAIERLGAAPIELGLTRIRRLRSHDGVARFMADPLSHAIAGIYTQPDLGRPEVFRLTVDQQIMDEGMVGLPDPSLYADDAPEAAALREAYRQYVEDLLGLVGWDRPAEAAAEILDLEARLAAPMWTPDRLRDRRANYHPMTRRELERYAAGFPWRSFLDERGVPVSPTDTVIVGTDTSVRAAARLFAETPVDVWKGYLAFHWVDNHAESLSTPFAERHFDFHGRTVGGRESPPSRTARGRGAIYNHLDRDLGRLYADRHFPASSKRDMVDMVRYLRHAYRQRVAAAEWMAPPTHAEALAKIEALTVNVGYPDVYRDFSSLRIAPDDPTGNLRRLRSFVWEYDRALLGRPFPDGEWPWGAAYYRDAANTQQLVLLTFPAAMVQLGYDPDRDPAANFAGIGYVIGHEMGHAFDDQGSGFDSRGRLRDWWDPATREAFEREAGSLADQFDTYEVLPGVFLDGRRMLGEALADLVGLEMALQAYDLYCEDTYSGACPTVDGLTPHQRFFLAYAGGHRSDPSEDALRNTAERGYHPPGEFRVNGVVRNMDAWYEAFGVGPEDDLYLPPRERVRLW